MFGFAGRKRGVWVKCALKPKILGIVSIWKKIYAYIHVYPDTRPRSCAWLSTSGSQRTVRRPSSEGLWWSWRGRWRGSWRVTQVRDYMWNHQAKAVTWVYVICSRSVQSVSSVHQQVAHFRCEWPLLLGCQEQKYLKNQFSDFSLHLDVSLRWDMFPIFRLFCF